MGYRTSLNLKVIISIVSFKQNLNLKIQILAGNTLKLCLHSCSQISTTLILVSDGSGAREKIVPPAVEDGPGDVKPGSGRTAEL